MKSIRLFLFLALMVCYQQKYQIIVKQNINVSSLTGLVNSTSSKLIQKTSTHNSTKIVQNNNSHIVNKTNKNSSNKQNDNFEFQSVTMSNNDTIKQQIKNRLVQQQNAQMIRKQKTNKYLEQKLREIEGLTQMVKQIIDRQNNQQKSIKILQQLDFKKMLSNVLQFNVSILLQLDLYWLIYEEQKMYKENYKLKLENEKLKGQLIQIQEEKQQQNSRIGVLEQLYKRQQVKIANLTASQQQQHKNESEDQRLNSQQSFKQIEFSSRLNSSSAQQSQLNPKKDTNQIKVQNMINNNTINNSNNNINSIVNQQPPITATPPPINSFGDYRNMLNQQFGQVFKPSINSNMNQMMYPNINPELNQNMNPIQQQQYQQLTPEENYYYQNGLSQVQQAALDQLDFEDIAQDLN